MNPRACTVIGGQGFIGRSLVLRLLKLGNWIVRITDFAPTLHIDQHPVVSDALANGRASYFQVDIGDKSQLIAAVDGTSVVFYIENHDPSPCDYYRSYMYIVQGTKNVISACQECNVKRLIYNSSADVVFDGLNAIHYADESLPYPSKYQEMLNDLRAQAESLLLVANNFDGLLTCALRPCNVFGPGEANLVPALLNQANSFWGKFILGNGDNLCDFTYVENVAHAHICAAETLASHSGPVAGKAFFITNLEPMYYWDFVSRVCKSLGYQRPTIKVPKGLLCYMLPLLKWLHDQLGSEGSEQLASARFCVQLGLFTRTFSCTAAEEHLGYLPIVTLEEGLGLTIKSLSHCTKENLIGRHIDLNEDSEVEKLLGGGKVADILLWRDEKESFRSFLVVFSLFCWFFAVDWTFITSASTLMLLVAIFLFAQNFLPFDLLQWINWLLGRISESELKDLLGSLAHLWNKGINTARSLAHGDNWSLFVKVVVPMYFLTLIFSLSYCTVLSLVAAFVFTSFFTYEQYKAEIDSFAKVMSILVGNLKSSLMESLPGPVLSFFLDDSTCCEEASGCADVVELT